MPLHALVISIFVVAWGVLPPASHTSALPYLPYRFWVPGFTAPPLHHHLRRAPPSPNKDKPASGATGYLLPVHAIHYRYKTYHMAAWTVLLTPIGF